MFRLLAMCCVLAALTLEAPLPARAAIGATITYDTVDAVEVLTDHIKVTGIISGQGASSATLYEIWGSPPSTQTSGPTDVAAARCDRLALLAMSKPGKFQFGLTPEVNSPFRYSCKLIVRTP